MINCMKCRCILPDDSLFCNKCGTRVESTGHESQIENELSAINEEGESSSSSPLTVNEPRKSRKKPLVFISVLILLIGLGLGVWYYQYTTNKIQEAKAKYESDLKQVVMDMIDLAAEGEEMINGYTLVWRGAIEAGDYAFYVVAKPREKIQIGGSLSGASIDGKRVRDFNEAIQLVYKKYEIEGKITSIRDKKQLIEGKMKELNNPPEEYKISFETAMQLFNSFNAYISMAESPSGSLLAYQQKTSELSSQIVSKVKEFQVRMPLN
jgi:hypothetical protein